MSLKIFLPPSPVVHMIDVLHCVQKRTFKGSAKRGDKGDYKGSVI